MARINSGPTMGYEGLQNINYNNMVQAKLAGEQAKLNTSKEKNARIRQSLANAEAERNLSSQVQAKYSAILEHQAQTGQPDVMETAPKSVVDAFNKGMKGTATAADNSLVLSYVQAAKSEQDMDLKRQIDLSAINKNRAAAAADLATLPNLEAQQMQYDTIAGTGFGANQPVNRQQPPAALSDFVPSSQAPMAQPQLQPQQDQNIPIDMSFSNAMEGQPNLQERSPFVSEIPVQAATPAQTNPNDPYVLDASGNRVPMSTTGAAMTGANAEVVQLTQEAINNGSSPERAQTAAMAKVEVDLAKQNYLNKNTGNTRNLQTYGQFVAEMTAAGQMDQARINEIAKDKVDMGELYAAPSSEAVTEKADEFDKEFDTFTSKMNDLFKETTDLSSTADKLYGEISWMTVGLMGQIQTVKGLAADFIPGGKSPLQVKLLVEALRGKGTMNAILEAKEKGGGNTGLGQVSIPEFETLRAIKSQINQGLQGEDLREATQRFIYLQKRNALRMYEEFTKQYGRNTGLALPSVNRTALSSFAEDVTRFENDTEYGRNHRDKYGSTLPPSFFAPAISNPSQNNSMNQTNVSGETNKESFKKGARARIRNNAIGKSAVNSAMSSVLPGSNILKFLDRKDPLMGDIELQ